MLSVLSQTAFCGSLGCGPDFQHGRGNRLRDLFLPEMGSRQDFPVRALRSGQDLAVRRGPVPCRCKPGDRIGTEPGKPHAPGEWKPWIERKRTGGRRELGQIFLMLWRRWWLPTMKESRLPR